MTTDDVKNIALIAGLVVVAREFQKMAQNNEIDTLNEMDVNLDNLTFDLVSYDTRADIIYYALWEYWIVENEALVVSTMMDMQNSDDVKQLMKAYGVRCWGPFCTPIGLSTSIELYLEESEQGEINADYAAKGILIRF